jgi:hypothetical protein
MFQVIFIKGPKRMMTSYDAKADSPPQALGHSQHPTGQYVVHKVKSNRLCSQYNSSSF